MSHAEVKTDFRFSGKRWVEALSVKVSAFSGQILREQTPIQELIAQSTAALRAARTGFFTAMDAVWEVAHTGAEAPLKLKAELYASSFGVCS